MCKLSVAIINGNSNDGVDDYDDKDNDENNNGDISLIKFIFFVFFWNYNTCDINPKTDKNAY